MSWTLRKHVALGIALQLLVLLAMLSWLLQQGVMFRTRIGVSTFQTQEVDVANEDGTFNTENISLALAPFTNFGNSSSSYGQHISVNDPRPRDIGINSTAITYQPRPRKRYLLPVIHTGGQNVQFTSFKKATAFAYLQNRTIVLAPFFLHGGDQRGWNMRHWRNFSLAFDVDILNQIVPVASLNEFKSVCDGRMKAIHPSNDRTFKANKTLERFLEIERAPKKYTFKTPPYAYDSHILEEEPCLAILLPHYLNPPEKEVGDLIDNHFVRSPIIQEAVDFVLDNVCQGGRLMALHWRNRTGEACVHFWRREEVKKECMKIIPEAAQIAKFISQPLKAFMDRENFACMYVAHPNFAKDVMMYLKETIPEDRLIDSDITTTWNMSAFRQLNADPFQMSLFEQEICYRADLFLRPVVSNWSDFIEEQRLLIGKKTTRVRAIAGLDSHAGRTVSKRYEKYL
uniref:GDP-fucose protein O-fucosyltransferase 2 n=1 Tax=Saccoglossus kowalevskii TaxID=10224 RepID=A0ABM0MEH3_SACKO|nr:PREDICTED: uncharacterized protein LOC102808457 [Saccoglossus kowalevskii]